MCLTLKVIYYSHSVETPLPNFHIGSIQSKFLWKILIHVGTNDVDNLVNIEPKYKQKPFDIERAYDCMNSDYCNLIGVIRKKKPKLSIILSAILPRPKDHMNTDPLIRKVNGYIEKQMAKLVRSGF